MDLHSENNGHRLILYLPGYNSHKRNCNQSADEVQLFFLFHSLGGRYHQQNGSDDLLG